MIQYYIAPYEGVSWTDLQEITEAELRAHIISDSPPETGGVVIAERWENARPIGVMYDFVLAGKGISPWRFLVDETRMVLTQLPSISPAHPNALSGADRISEL